MKEKKALNQLISLLPMPAVVIDNKGIIEEANIVFKEKFNLNRISKKNRVKLKVLFGGVLTSNKGVNLPNTNISLPCLTKKDKNDLEFILQNKIEWIGLSFVRSAKDVRLLKTIIKRHKESKALVIAKIEKPEAISDIDNIILSTDAIMVARGDLGVEVPSHKVPVYQKMIVQKKKIFQGHLKMNQLLNLLLKQ